MVRRGLVISVVAVWLAACGGAPPAPALPAARATPVETPDPRPTFTPLPLGTVAGLAGRLAISREDGVLSVLDLATGQETVVISVPGAHVGGVSWSPAGKQLAYSLITRPAGAQAPYADLYVVDGCVPACSAVPRVLAQHDSPAAQLLDPAWGDAGTLYFTYSATYYDQSGAVHGYSLELRSLQVASGTWRTLLVDGTEPGVAPGGHQIAAVINNRTTSRPALWLAEVPTVTVSVLVPETAFEELHAPRFAADGRAVLFSAAREETAPEPTPGGLRLLDRLLGVRAALAAGRRADLWRVTTDATEITRVTELQEATPRAAVSPDGRWIALLAARGTYVLDSRGGNLVRISDHGGQGAISWGVP